MTISLKRQNSDKILVSRNDISEIQSHTIVTPNETERIEKPELDKLTIFADSEFNQSIDKGMVTLAVPLFCPELDAIFCTDKDELSDSYDLISYLLARQGYKIDKVNRIQLESKINDLWKKKGYKSFTKKSLADFLKERLVRLEFEKLNLDIDKSEFDYSKKRKVIYIKFKSVEVELQFFFEYADLFRIFGKECQVIWYERAKLTQFRTIKIMGNVRVTKLVDGVPTDFNIKIFDNRYCLPPIKGSLENQAKTFGADKYLEILAQTTNNSEIKRLISESKNKIKISEVIKERYGDVVDEQWCKENMDIVREKYPDIFAEYAMMDCLVTWALNQALNGLLTEVCELLAIPAPNLAETCGKNIENILLALITKHFQISDDEESIFNSKNLKELISSGRSEALVLIDGNQYGIIPSTVTGGLLFSRTAKNSLITGNMFDLDLASCYATGLCAMNLYLGQPVHLTLKYQKPSLKRVFELLKARNIPMDAWYLQVSGTLNKAVNTLILSNSQFDSEKCILTDYKRYAMPSDIDLEEENLNLIDAEKPSEPTSTSKISLKEINGGKVTYATITALSDLPEEHFEEFMNLSVDAIIYYEPSLMCDSVEELLIKKSVVSPNSIEEYLTDNLQKTTVTKLSDANCSLRFPIATYYQEIKRIRKQMKDAENPVQEIFKLILNSTYGILASLVMLVNNSVSANWITSCARAAASRMTNALNGLNPITDGTAINGDTIPLGMTFHEVLAKYPDYLEHYQPEIKNDVTLSFKKPGDFNKMYIEHLEKFIGKSDWLTRMYEYDLKDEDGEFHYNKHYNTNAGNYVKSGKHGDTFKCRSYRKTPELISWFKESCESDYKRHLIYADKSIIKLSQGSVDAMRILKDAEEVANRDKRLVKMPVDLAAQIAVTGICHPMGFSRHEIKVLKLISPSQFLPKDFRQSKILNALYEECKSISKILLPGTDWHRKLSIKKIETEFPIITSDGYLQNVEYREDLNYEYYNKLNPVGLGFELLIWGNEDFKCLNDVRNRFVELINDYDVEDEKWNIRENLHWSRLVENLETNIYLKHFLASVVIAKLNYEIDYRTTLANSVNDPMSRVQFLGDITTLKYEQSKRF